MTKNPRAKLAINNVSIELNPFAEEFLARTVVGAVSSLKGAENIRDLELHMEGGRCQDCRQWPGTSSDPFPQGYYRQHYNWTGLFIKGGRQDRQFEGYG